jgi:nucleoside-diphosphate-sugar epimerase
MNVIDACLKQGVGRLFVASSSEVYQSPPRIPTDEDVPLVVPDVMNPRYSYGGGKIISELLAVNFGRRHFERVIIYRPHNVYGPDMGGEHVIPQFALRMARLCQEHPHGAIPFPIQGEGKETRSYCNIEDFVQGVMLAEERGQHLNVYHIGTQEEITVAELAHRVAACFGREIEIKPGELTQGSALRRCPDISKICALGYAPRISLEQGLPSVCRWYQENAEKALVQ